MPLPRRNGLRLRRRSFPFSPALLFSFEQGLVTFSGFTFFALGSSLCEIAGHPRLKRQPTASYSETIGESLFPLFSPHTLSPGYSDESVDKGMRASDGSFLFWLLMETLLFLRPPLPPGVLVTRIWGTFPSRDLRRHPLVFFFFFFGQRGLDSLGPVGQARFFNALLSGAAHCESPGGYSALSGASRFSSFSPFSSPPLGYATSVLVGELLARNPCKDRDFPPHLLRATLWEIVATPLRGEIEPPGLVTSLHRLSAGSDVTSSLVVFFERYVLTRC